MVLFFAVALWCFHTSASSCIKVHWILQTQSGLVSLDIAAVQQLYAIPHHSFVIYCLYIRREQ